MEEVMEFNLGMIVGAAIALISRYFFDKWGRDK